MQFANAAGVQTHVHAGNVLGNTEFSLRDLTSPAAGCQPHVSVREREAQIRKRALVGRGWNKQIGILPVTDDIARTGIGAAMSRALRLRHWFPALGAGNSCSRQNAASGGRGQQCSSRDVIHNMHSFEVSALRKFLQAYVEKRSS